ncbi:PAS domain S-box protein [Dyadobacter psychrotolerans]|uniref:PAS domain S-box protein n=1 Tax=Dyadobacter psychrotolerans TaxID=2541721 RepID=A0A4R5DPS4_9BACT|nr:PAS domain S-box protein [Dyadobacter psychrotolerans]TDE16332.1 PAS domain S-box protein [Dyadobacter psychrotolerans]
MIAPEILPLNEDVRFRKLIESGKEGLSLLNKFFEFVFSASSCERIVGWSSEDLLGLPITDLIHYEDLEFVTNSLQDTLTSPGSTITCVFRFKQKDNSFIWIECLMTDMLDDTDVQAIVCRYSDVTEKKKSAKMLLEANTELHAFRFALDESAIVAVTDRKGIIKHVNDNFCRISKYERSELIGKDHRIINSSFHEKNFIQTLWRTISNGQIWKGELKNKAKDGSFYWVDTTIVPFLDDFGHPYKYVAIRSDISQRKLMEEKSRIEEIRLRLLESVITHTKDAILITEAESLIEPGPRILYVNEAFTKMTGYSSSEVIGKSPRLLQGPKTGRTELKRLSEALRNWHSCEITIANYKKSGEEFWVNLTVTPVANESGWYTHWISVERDVTESRKLEQEYNQIFDLAPDIICTVGLDGYFKKINPAMSELLEYSRDELLSRPIVKFIHPQDQVRIMAELEIKNKGTKTFYFENRCITKSGQVKWLAWTSTPATPEGLIFTVAKNITDKKELEGLLNKVTRMAGIGGWVIDLIKSTIYWSEVTKEIYEVKSDYEPNMQRGLDFLKEESDKILITRRIELASEKGISFDMELQIVTANQNIKWVRVIGEPEFENNRCVRIRGSFQDIDIRKRSELLATEALFEKKLILESIGDAFFAVDKHWIINYWNNKAEKVLQKTKLQTKGFNLWDVFAGSIGSESYIKYHQAIKTNKALHFEDYYPPLKKWYEISAYPSANGLSVYFKDITERKKRITALAESEKNYSSLFHLSPLPMWVFDIKSLAFLDVNEAAVKKYGYQREEFLAMTIMDIREQEDIGKVKDILSMKNTSQQSLSHQGIFRHKKKNGELIHVDIQSNLIRYKGVLGKIIIANDMTENFNYTRKIEQQNIKFQEIAWIQSHVVRAPLARIMSIVPMLKNSEDFGQERETLLEYLLIASNELDEVIKTISKKTRLAQNDQI